jgi:hypothetical protein
MIYNTASYCTLLRTASSVHIITVIRTYSKSNLVAAVCSIATRCATAPSRSSVDDTLGAVAIASYERTAMCLLVHNRSKQKQNFVECCAMRLFLMGFELLALLL